MDERVLLWGSLALAALAAGIAWILERPGRGRADAADEQAGEANGGPLLTLVLVAVLTAAAAAGGDAGARNWAMGLAAGGVAAVLASILAGGSHRDDGILPVAAFSLGVIVPAALLLGWRAVAVDSLAGVASGWIVAALILVPRTDGVHRAQRARILVAAAVFAVAVAAAAILGALRDASRPDDARWAAAAVAICAAVPFAATLRGVLSRLMHGRTGGMIAAVTAILCVLAAAAILGNTLRYERLPLVVAAGIGAAVVSWAAVAEMGAGAVALFVVLAGALAGFYLEAGLGVALAIAAGSVIAPAARYPIGLSRALAFGVIFALYRVASTRFEELMSGPAITDPFLLFTLLGGALAPRAVTGFLDSPDGLQGRSAHARRLAGIAAIAAVVGLIVLLWGARAAIGVTIGAAVSLATAAGAQMGRAADTAGQATVDANAILAALLIAALTAHWTAPLVALAPVTRADKIAVVAVAAAIAIVAIAAAEWMVRPRARRAQPPVPEVRA